jgi:hypothetical protein
MPPKKQSKMGFKTGLKVPKVPETLAPTNTITGASRAIAFPIKGPPGEWTTTVMAMQTFE